MQKLIKSTKSISTEKQTLKFDSIKFITVNTWILTRIILYETAINYPTHEAMNADESMIHSVCFLSTKVLDIFENFEWNMTLYEYDWE